MASYHLSVSIMGRSDGRSAVAAAAYRAGAAMIETETGRVIDYTRKGGIVAAEIIAPDGAPEWATDRDALWNAVHAKEKRTNSQLAREIELALPLELDPAARADLVRGWVRAECVSQGMIADIAIHDPDPAPGRSRNPHAHVMLTMRPLDPAAADGWAKNKNRDWNAPDLLERWRASWAEAQNTALKEAEASARVDHRSLTDQRTAALAEGDDLLALVLDRPPEPRLGVAATAIEKRAAMDGATGPVTDRGRAVARSRTLRSRLLSALTAARKASRTIANAVRSEPRRSRRDPIADLQAWRRDQAETDSPALADAPDVIPDAPPDDPADDPPPPDDEPSGP